MTWYVLSVLIWSPNERCMDWHMLKSRHLSTTGSTTSSKKEKTGLNGRAKKVCPASLTARDYQFVTGSVHLKYPMYACVSERSMKKGGGVDMTRIFSVTSISQTVHCRWRFESR